MNIKYFIALVLLFGAVTRATDFSTESSACECSTTTPRTTTPRTTRTTTPRPTRPTTPKPTTQPPPSWLAAVLEHVERCRASLIFFSGETNKVGNTLEEAYECLIDILMRWSSSQSLIISSCANEILLTKSTMVHVGDSPSGILNGLGDTLSTICHNHVNLILTLGDIIDVSTSDLADAITDLIAKLSQTIAVWKNAALCEDKIDEKQLLQGIQKLTNAVAYVSEEALKKCENDAVVRHVLLIVAAIFDDVTIIALAVINSVAATVLQFCGHITNPWKQCLNVIDNLTRALTKALNAVVNTALETVISIVRAIVDLAKSLNEVLKNVLGLVEYVIPNLGKTVSNTLTGVTSGLLKIGK